MDGNGNGRHPDGRLAPEHTNPYAEVYEGTRPPELIRYDLNTDPYANTIPRPDRFVIEGEARPSGDEPRRRNPILVVVSLVLIGVLVLPITIQVLMRLFH